MNLLTLTDSKLATLHRHTANEIVPACQGRHQRPRCRQHRPRQRNGEAGLGGRRCREPFDSLSRAAELWQDHAAGRCLGNRPRQHLRGLAVPVRLSGDPRRACDCSYKQIERHLRKLPVADISIEMVCPPEREMRSAGTALAEMRQQIEAKTGYESLELGEDSRNLLKAAMAELALDADVRNRILAVARTIANLDRCQRIEARHLCEAINYRMLGR